MPKKSKPEAVMKAVSVPGGQKMVSVMGQIVAVSLPIQNC